MCPLKKRVVVFNNDDLNNDILSTEAATQRIYIQKPAGTASVPKKEDAWVDNTGNSVTGTAPDAASGQTPVWTTKYPAYQKNYPLIYTAIQRKDKNNRVTCTTPSRDESMTIIDGGRIITGSIMANKLDVYDAAIQKIRADAIDTASITIGENQVTGLANDLAGKQQAGYITKIDNGIKVHDANDSANYVLVGANGMDVYKNINDAATKVAAFGSDILIGRTGTNDGNTFIDSNGVHLRKGTTDLATFTSDYTALGGGAAKLKYSTDSVFSNNSHRVVLSKATHEPDIRNDATLSSRDIATFTDSTPMAFVNASHYVNTAGTEQTAEAGIYAWRGRGLNKLPAFMRVDANVVTNATYALIYADDIELSVSKQNGEVSINGSNWSEVVQDAGAGATAAAKFDDWEPTLLGIGTTYSGSGSKSLASGSTYTSTNVKVDLEKGTWVVTYSVEFPKDPDGQRASRLNIGGEAIATSECRIAAGTDAIRVINGTAIYENGGSSTVAATVYAWQTSGASMSVTANISAVRII